MPEIPRYHILPTGTVNEVITVLQSLKERGMISGDSQIVTFDAETDMDERLTGLMIEVNGTIKLYTDED
jgi:hypothetical protein